jgi:hypothetical protein
MREIANRDGYGQIIKGTSSVRAPAVVQAIDLGEIEDFFIFFWGGGYFLFLSHYIQHCFICRPSDSTVPTDAGIEPRTAVHWQSDALTTRLDLIRTRLDLIRN